MMASLSEDIQSASSDTRPPMLDRSYFESWQQHIHLYCKGKDNGENILQSIDEGPFKMGSSERHPLMNKGETIHEYYVKFTKLINNIRNIKMTMPKMQLNSKFVNNMLPEWGRFVTAVKLNRGLKTSNYGKQENTFNIDVDEAPVQDLALNEDHTMFMANLSSASLIYDEAGPSYDLEILSEVQDHDNYLDSVNEYHEVHEMQSDVQQNYIVDSDVEYTSDSNIILYEQYVKNNAEQIVQSNVSFVLNDALMMIINYMHK
uniref:Retrovirus-related Pol polyprotein from transposon TNT 1-94 n=1 Tax=Tanacetum cinerariifolium TaxID=118510 RepID=A0A699HML0_TANCI|nr:retrovirus-related Pol polyprotein from transposon TNT 1-94 [Tanacetum cinerariifolium]